MEIHQLRYLVAVAQAGNFSRAAEQCHVSQPSLSQQIQKLEEELGERLFDRMKRSVKLTQHGERFLPRAVKILEEVEAAKREASEAKDLLQGTLTIGALPTIAPYLLPLPLGQFIPQNPHLEIIIQEETTERLVKLLLACEVDLAFVSRPIRNHHLVLQDLFAEELLLALPPQHPLAGKAKVTPHDLKNQPLIVMKEGHCLGDQVLGFCERSQLHPRLSFRSGQLETIQSLVYAGLGLSLIPAMAVQQGRAETPAYRSLHTHRPERQIVAAWLKQRPLGKAARQFLDLIPLLG